MPNHLKLQQIPDHELIELIRTDHDYMSVVYKRTRDNCLRYMYKMNAGSNVKQEDLHEIYQNAVTILYEKIIYEDFQLTNNASIQTYLTSVCRYQLLDQFKKVNKRSTIEERESQLEDLQIDPSIEDGLREIMIQDEEQFRAIEMGLNKMKIAGGNCYEILVLFWYHSKSIREITERFGFANESTAKVQKYKCQKRLRRMAHGELKTE